MSKHRTIELEYAFTKQEKHKELIGKLTALNGQITPEEANRLYNACLTWITDFNACQITEIGKLIKEKLGIPATLFKRDLNRLEKERPEDAVKGKEKTQNGKEPLTAYFPGIVDIIEIEGKPAFLLIKEGELCYNETAEIEGQVYLPPPREHLPWLLPRGSEVVLKHYKELKEKGITWVQTLCDEIYNFLYNTSEMPSDDYYREFLVPWILHTYLLEHFDYSPILCLYAVPERGKSRTGKAISYLSYRGAVVESLRESNIIRLATDCKATIFFDVMGLWKKAERNQSEDVILGRFERGYIVPRVLYPERGAFKDTKIFKVFGATILATNESIHNILETRAITINMPEASRRFTGNVTHELALPLKEKLTAFRAYYLDKPLPDAPKPATGRLGDILQPLYQVVRLIKGDKDSAFLDFVSKLENERRMDRADTVEAQVVRAIVALESEVERGILPVKLITDTINETRPENRKFSYQKIGKKLDALGFEKGWTHEGNRSVIWDCKKISQLEGKYGLKQTPVTAGLPPPKSALLTGVTGVCLGGGGPENSQNFSKETPESKEKCIRCGNSGVRYAFGQDANGKGKYGFFCLQCRPY